MERVKLFKGVSNEVHELEREINAWLEESKARIISVTGNIAPQGDGGSSFATSDIFVMITYEAAS